MKPAHGNVAVDETSDEESGVTATLCHWIANLCKEDIPDDVVERAKHLILDGIGCGLVGAHVPWSEKAAEAVLDYEPLGQCTLIGYSKVWQFF